LHTFRGDSRVFWTSKKKKKDFGEEIDQTSTPMRFQEVRIEAKILHLGTKGRSRQVTAALHREGGREAGPLNVG